MHGQMTRRRFLGLAAAAGIGLPLIGCAKQGATGITARQLIDNVGVQLYTARDLMAENPEKTLQDIADIGYKTIETAGIDILDSHGSYMQDLGLQPLSAHFNFAFVTGTSETGGITVGSSTPGYDRVLDTANEWGLKYVVLPYLPGNMRGGLEEYRALAEQMNYAGALAEEAGLKFCYHNHSFEFQPMGNSTPLEVILENTDPDLVGIEGDLFWVSVGGVNPVKFLKIHSDRITLLHLKDKAADTPQSYSSAPSDAFREVGNGVFDFEEIMSLSADIGVKQCFVEQDQTPGNPINSLRTSFNYLRQLQV